MDPPGAIECRYRKYGQRSQILWLLDGSWHAEGSQFCLTRILVGILVGYVVFISALLFVCAFVRNQFIVEGDDGGWWRELISHGIVMVRIIPPFNLGLVNPWSVASGLPSLIRSSLRLSGSFCPQARPPRSVHTSHPVIFFFCGWISCGNATHIPCNAFARPLLAFTFFGIPISVSSWSAFPCLTVCALCSPASVLFRRSLRLLRFRYA